MSAADDRPSPREVIDSRQRAYRGDAQDMLRAYDAEVDRLRAELAETRAAGDALAFAVAPIERMGRGAPGSRLDVLITRAEEWRSVRGDAPAEPPADGPGGTSVVRSGVGRGFPRVHGRCPACRSASLFLAVGDHVTCASLSCPNPTAVADQLDCTVPDIAAEQPPADEPSAWILIEQINGWADALDRGYLRVGPIVGQMKAVVEQYRHVQPPRQPVVEPTDPAEETAAPDAAPRPDWSGAWAELTGYVRAATDPIDPARIDAYMVELKREALRPFREWWEQLAAGQPVRDSQDGGS